MIIFKISSWGTSSLTWLWFKSYLISFWFLFWETWTWKWLNSECLFCWVCSNQSHFERDCRLSWLFARFDYDHWGRCDQINNWWIKGSFYFFLVSEHWSWLEWKLPSQNPAKFSQKTQKCKILLRQSSRGRSYHQQDSSTCLHSAR